ncbi:hypothetical protein [Sphingomonas sp. URHD0057]|uniref:hypothetical protein n=1 Tax=Sphingomonas sp. URHD0057 TaxID=1380389 RepID=UPI0004903919|nr:hypothetical protein [Sphingomonas sp. URHD0057]
MNTLWSYFWPLLAVGPVIGIVAGSISFRLPPAAVKDKLEGVPLATHDLRRKRWLALGIGAAVAIAAAALWAGPMHAADLFAQRVERDARLTLDNYEMYQVTGRLHRRPLSRRLILSGPADDFQRSELSRILALIPGVREARWSTGGGVPLIVESGAATILGFLFGVLLAYFVELRRRFNAQWNW